MIKECKKHLIITWVGVALMTLGFLVMFLGSGAETESRRVGVILFGGLIGFVGVFLLPAYLKCLHDINKTNKGQFD